VSPKSGKKPQHEKEKMPFKTLDLYEEVNCGMNMRTLRCCSQQYPNVTYHIKTAQCGGRVLPEGY